MAFDLIRIQHLRNIREGELRPAKGLNLILGENGSGKSSLLEAVYMLGRGSSFRGRRVGDVITHGEKSLHLYATFIKSGMRLRVGVKKSRKGGSIQLNGTTIARLSQLVREIPVQIITPRSHEILERGPELRRRLLDWGVFHVEHGYHDLNRRYQLALSQRNATLKQGGDDLSIWEREMDQAGTALDQMRKHYVSILVPVFQKELDALLQGTIDVDIHYRRGWSDDTTLRHALEKSRLLDRKRGFSTCGAHRADLVVKMDGHPVAAIASRGQQKMMICALMIAQGRLTSERSGVPPVVLIDDLAAELDLSNRQRVLHRLLGHGYQCLFTATDARTQEGQDVAAVFHVEQGMIKPG